MKKIRLAISRGRKDTFKRKYPSELLYEGYNRNVGHIGCWYWMSDRSLPKELEPFLADSPPLSIELIPTGSWGINARTFPQKAWDLIRNNAYEQAGYCCEICG